MAVLTCTSVCTQRKFYFETKALSRISPTKTEGGECEIVESLRTPTTIFIVFMGEGQGTSGVGKTHSVLRGRGPRDTWIKYVRASIE